MAHRHFHKPRVGGATGVTLHPDRLSKPLGWRKPRRIFVNSLSDLFHDDVPAEFIGSVFDMMARTPRHTYQILTKRPARMRSLLTQWGSNNVWSSRAQASFRRHDMMWCEPDQWPLPNVWLGVSVENQKWVDIRIPILRDTPAAVRWLSCEPLLGPVDPAWDFLAGIGWVVVGGESGPGARPMHPDWARILRDRCVKAATPFFFKQSGEVLAREWGCTDRKGHNPAEWPEPFPREYPDAA